MSKKNNRGTRRAHFQKACEKAQKDAEALERKRLARKESAKQSSKQVNIKQKEKVLDKEQDKKENNQKEQQDGVVVDIFAALNGALGALPDAKCNFQAPPEKPVEEEEGDSAMDGTIVSKKKKKKTLKTVNDLKKQMAIRRQVQKREEKAEVRRKRIAKKKLQKMEDSDASSDDEEEVDEDEATALERESRPTETRRDIKIRKRIEKRDRKGLTYVQESKEKRRKRVLLKRKEGLRLKKRKLGASAGVIKQGGKYDTKSSGVGASASSSSKSSSSKSAKKKSGGDHLKLKKKL